jgi:hypothetical protein
MMQLLVVKSQQSWSERFDIEVDSTKTNFNDLGNTFEVYVGTLYNLDITEDLNDSEYGTKE